MTVPNDPYPALARAVDPTVLRSIRQASQSTSTDFGLLMAQAARESGFQANAKSASSSAAGLFQFVDSTWLDMVHRYGDKYGIGDLAQQISQSGSGKLVVANPGTREKILALRQDPTLSADLAAEYAKQNQSEIEQAIGRPLSRGELYMAHFLGAGGATEFLKTLDTKGGTIAAKLLPDAAAANPNIFYDASGRGKTVAELYQTVATRIEKDASAFGSAAPNSAAPASAVAAVAAATGEASSGLSVAALGRPIDWSGIKLSPATLAMLNVVALAALKMSDDNVDQKSLTPPPAPAARPPRSI